MNHLGKHRGVRASWLVTVIFAFASFAGAQNASTGAISGTITDPAGAVVAGASVTVTNPTTGESRTTTSGASGNYVVSLLPPGSYRLVVTKPGFKRSEHADITVHITETITDNVLLDVGAQNEVVSVNEAGEILHTQESTLGNVVDQREVQSLPLVTRNYQQILGLSTGVSAEIFNAGDIGRGGVEAPLVTGGASYTDNNFQMNGVEVNDLQGSGHFSGGVSSPNPDTIQEFKVQTSQYDASFGRNAGANVNVLTKSGTNLWHGDLWEFFRNEDLNANNYFNKQTGQPRQVLRQNQFGFTLGGPIVKDRLLFFTSYQGTRQKNGVDSSCSSSVILPVLTNDRSAAGLAASVGAGTAFGGVDPYTGNPVTAANISPQAVALFNAKGANGQYLIPSPQVLKSTPGGPEGFSTYSIACPYTEDQFMVNLDWLQNSKSSFQERFFWANSQATFTLPVAQAAGTPMPGSPSTNPQNFRDFSLSHTYVFTSNLVNQAQIGFTRNYSGTNQSFPITYSALGVTAPSFDDTRANIGVLGGFDVGGNGQTVLIGQNNYILQDTLSWIHGRHTIRVGGSVTRSQDNISQFAYGAYTIFLDYPGLMIGDAPFNPFESLDLAGIFQRSFRVWDGSLYAQDDIKLTPKLTLNLGMRYERLGDVGEANGRNANVDPALLNPNPPAGGTLQGIVVASNFPGQVPDGVTRANNNLTIAGNDQNTWDPRVGFAWVLPGSDRFVLRGGFGIYHQRITGQPTFQLETNQPWAQFRVLKGTGGFGNPFLPNPGAFPQFAPYTPPVQVLPGLWFPTSQLSPFAISQGLKPATFEQYSMNLQAQITPSMVLQIGYSGSHGTDLLGVFNMNQGLRATAAAPVRGLTSDTYNNFFARVPYEGFTQILEDRSVGYSWYNSLQASFEKRFSHGLQFLASYTFSKDLTSIWGSTTGPNGGTQVGDTTNLNADYGPDIFIRPHRFVFTYVYEIPGFKNGHSWASEILSGWKIAGVTTLQSGQLLPVLDINPTNVYSYGFTYDFATATPGCKPNLGGSVTGRANNGWVDASCFTAAPTISADGGTGFGNTGMGTVKGPAQANSDMSLVKLFPLHWENTNLEFRAEAFNVFNQVNFANPDLYYSDGPAAFGKITTINGNPRILQLALKLNF